MGMENDPQGAAAAPPPAAYPASSGPAPQAPCPPPGADGHSVQGGMGAAPAWPAIPQPPADPNRRFDRGPARGGPGVVDAEFAETPGYGPFGPIPPHPMRPHFGAPYGPRPQLDGREYVLGFRKNSIPGVPLMARAEALALARKATAGLVESLTTGTRFDFDALAWRLTQGAHNVEVTSRSQIVFRGKRLIVASRCARHFGIVDIKVGNRGQLLSSEAMPASAFMGSSRSVKLHLDTATVGQDVTIIVVNLSRRARTFEAVVIGSEAS